MATTGDDGVRLLLGVVLGAAAAAGTRARTAVGDRLLLPLLPLPPLPRLLPPTGCAGRARTPAAAAAAVVWWEVPSVPRQLLPARALMVAGRASSTCVAQCWMQGLWSCCLTSVVK
jgi:hypothetical protein